MYIVPSSHSCAERTRGLKSLAAYHSVNSCELSTNGWLAVIGCGGLGQLAIRYAKAMGFRVVGLDVNDSTLAQASLAGADWTFNTLANANYVHELQTLTKGGVDAAAVYTGSNAAYASAPKILRVNGVVMLVGIPSSPLQVSVIELCNGRFRIKAESTSVPSRMVDAINFSLANNIIPDVEIYALEDINAMIERMRSGQSSKRMVVVF